MEVSLAEMKAARSEANQEKMEATAECCVGVPHAGTTRLTTLHCRACDSLHRVPNGETYWGEFQDS